MLSDEIDDAPSAVSLLYMRERERRNFGSTQTASEEYSDNGSIAEPSQRRDVWRVEQHLGLPR